MVLKRARPRTLQRADEQRRIDDGKHLVKNAHWILKLTLPEQYIQKIHCSLRLCI